MVAKVFSGAKAYITIDNQIVGLFDSCNYSVSVSAEAIHLLGRYSADEIVHTAYEAVQLDCSGFRVIGQGFHILPKAPKLEDLLNLESIQISVIDRGGQPGDTPILTVNKCIPIRWGTGYQAKATSRINISYLGTNVSDESGNQAEVTPITLP